MKTINEIYDWAFNDELAKIAGMNKLISIATKEVPKVHKDLAARRDAEAQRKHKSGVGAGATPAERRRLNVLKKSKSTTREY